MATPIPRNGASFTPEELLAATGGALRASFASEVKGIAIDSRTVEVGNLFVALRGPTHDGHDHLEEAARRRASGAIVARGAVVPSGLGAVEVPDTLRALGDVAALHRRRWAGEVVAITGSAGKTTTKELVAAALSAGGCPVHRTAGNLNNRVGVPMTIFELAPPVRLAILEVGTSEPGEIARLGEIAAPDIAVVTLVAAAHTEGLGSIEAVAAEKAALFLALEPSGVAVVNADVPGLRDWIGRSPARRVLFFGRGEEADVRLEGWSFDEDGRTRCRLLVRDRGAVELRMRLLGEAAALNAATALAVTLARDGDLTLAAAALEDISPTPGRMRPVEGIYGTLVLDDSYNANPRSMALALETAARLARERGGRAVAVLGDMKELGPGSVSEHRAVGDHAAEVGIDLLVCIGAEMAFAAEAAGSRGVRVISRSSVDEAFEIVPGLLSKGDVVLVKGSRSMAMERVVSIVAAEEGAR